MSTPAPSLPSGCYTTTDLKGKLALITGATGGIGRATAHTLARRGLDLALHFRTSRAAADALAEELASKYGVRARAFSADLASYDEVRALHAAVVRELGHPDVLYNNAGLASHVVGIKGRITDVPVEEFENTWRVNAGSAFLLSQLCIPHMEQEGWGRVIFCSSVAATTGGVIGPHYASSKSALHGVMHWIANQYARSGITCNAVAPALIEGTDMFSNPTPAHLNLVPMGRFGQPEEIASIVELLVTNAYMTNKIVSADGGMLPSVTA
ncbi:putative short-chain dehydrogenase/reductase [Dentipellis sp. KUC8613]|nr:putative short-chain dehydrogenase/reductase [Dentipellis sp. KUC8613]